MMPLSLILNELGTNALKYGTLGHESRLHIWAASCDEMEELRWDWRELRHVPLDAPPEQPSRQGFGTQLMQAMIESRLGGSFERRLDEAGFHCAMRFPKGQVEVAQVLA